MTTDFGEQLATRRFTWRGDDGALHTAFVDISLPRLVPPDGDGGAPCYVCAVRLRGFGDDAVRPAYGEDAVQALHLALVHAGALIARHPLARRFDWAVLPNFGFPELRPHRPAP